VIKRGNSLLNIYIDFAESLWLPSLCSQALSHVGKERGGVASGERSPFRSMLTQQRQPFCPELPRSIQIENHAFLHRWGYAVDRDARWRFLAEAFLSPETYGWRAPSSLCRARNILWRFWHRTNQQVNSSTEELLQSDGVSLRASVLNSPTRLCCTDCAKPATPPGIDEYLS
jgi:hypothetical protein